MKSIVVANWKMNPATMREAKRLFDATKFAADNAKHVTVIVAPPAIFLRDLKSRYKGRKIAFAAQTAHFETGGAFTGEISMANVHDAGASFVILGHAERRALGERDEDIRKKVAAAIAQKITPILCIGESKRGPEGEYFNFVKEQLRVGFADVEPSQLSRVVIAYEPIWAIGAASAMKPRDMHEMAIFIRKSLVDQKGEGGMNVKILYGGSVNETNVADMLEHGDVHGLLVGRASEDPTKMSLLLEAIENAS